MKTLQLQSDSLEVCKAERGEVGVFLCKVCQPVDDSGQLQEKQAFNDQIRVSNLFYIVGYKQPALIFSSQKQ